VIQLKLGPYFNRRWAFTHLDHYRSTDTVRLLWPHELKRDSLIDQSLGCLLFQKCQQMVSFASEKDFVGIRRISFWFAFEATARYWIEA